MNTLMSTTKSAKTKSPWSAAAAVFPLALALAMVAGGCGSNSSTSGTGGGTGTGGAGQTGSGGQSATGGRTGGSGGQPETGGQSGTGGVLGTGGVPGTGGQQGTGGQSGSGGAQATDGGTDASAGAGGQGALGGRGGNGGGGGTSNPDGGIPFAPCPTNGTACVVLPLGDSITDGFPFENGGYRVELFNQAVLGSQRLTFVGRLANGPNTVAGMTFPRNHEGYSGYTIVTGVRTGISGSLTDTAIATFRPHIILLMIGTNDVDLSVDLVNAPARLGALLDEIIAGAPNALLVVAQLTPTTTDAENVRFQAYNAAIPGLVQQRASAGKHVIRVDMYGAFTANVNYKTAYMNDNLHPNPAGYTLMGQTWYAAIRSYLPGP